MSKKTHKTECNIIAKNENKTSVDFNEIINKNGPLYRSYENFQKVRKTYGELTEKNTKKYIKFFNKNCNLMISILEYDIAQCDLISTEIVNDKGNTLLMLACEDNMKNAVSKLIKSGSFEYLNKSNHNNESALTLACAKSNPYFAIDLLNAGAKVNQQNKTEIKFLQKAKINGLSLLMLATQENKVELVKKLIQLDSEYINQKNEFGNAALTFACIKKNNDLALKLLKAGAKINKENKTEIKFLQRTTIDGSSLLMKAIEKHYDKAIEELIQLGSKYINLNSNSGNTALMIACHGKNNDLALKLLKAGAKINKENNSGKTALTYACTNENTDLAMQLLESGAKINKENKTEINFLKKAAINGSTLLITAVKNDYSNAASELMKLGYKYLNKTNKLGKTALDVAKKCDNNLLVKKIEEIKNNKEIKNLSKEFLKHCDNKDYFSMSKMISKIDGRDDLHKFKTCFSEALDKLEDIIPTQTLEINTLENLNNILFKSVQASNFHQDSEEITFLGSSED